MSSRFLPVVIKNALFALPRLVPVLQSGRMELERALGFCTEYRRLGIAELLLAGNPAAFHRSLQCSGAAFAAFLARATDAGKTASKSAPFYDSIVCGDISAASRIAQLSATALQPDMEYEDDFLYVRLLMSRFFLNASATDLKNMLTRYELLLDGNEDHRFRVCRALIANDAEQFNSALESLIVDREDDYITGIDADEIPEDDWSTEGKVFVEGLALVKLAMQLEMPVQNSYQFIPAIILASHAQSFDMNSWANPAAVASAGQQ